MTGRVARGKALILSVVVVTVVVFVGYLAFFAFRGVAQRFLGETPLLFSTILLAVALYRRQEWARAVSILIFLLSVGVNLTAGSVLLVADLSGWYLLVVAGSHAYCAWVILFSRDAARFLNQQTRQDRV